MIYEPAEDSELLARYVKKFAVGKVLDMGTGSGILAQIAAKKKRVSSVLAVDVQQDVVEHLRNVVHKKIKAHKKIKILESDLFAKVSGKFDTVVFNPPYLPHHPHETEKDALVLSGGRHGYEVLEKFLSQAGKYLKENGKIIIVFSSLTKKDRVEQFILQHGFDFEELEQTTLFMETLYCYLITFEKVLLPVKKKGVTDIQYFTAGKRGRIYVGMYKHKKVAIKIKHPSSEAVARIANEARWLKKLNGMGIGPTLIFSTDDYIVYAFVTGSMLTHFVGQHEADVIHPVLVDALRQCYELDKIRANKEEMHHPFKHIVVHGKKAVFLDFERMHYTKNPKNVTQFVQYLMTIEGQLNGAGFAINRHTLRRLAAEYKRYPDLAHLSHIIDAVR